MAERWYHYYDGDDTNDGLSPSSPRKLLPGQSGAVTVSAGDIINARAGVDFSGGGRLQPPANNLTYRTYGEADNALFIRLPGKYPGAVKTVRVNNGMWVLNGAGLGASTIDVQNARTGVTIEDVLVLGDAAGSSNAVTLGTSAAGTQSGITMRRFEIRGAAGKGLSCYKINPLLELFKISGTVDDCWTIVATATNLYRAGSTDIVRMFELVEPNVNAAGSLVGDSGDGWQTLHASGRFESALTVTDWLLEKTNPVKQGFVLCDALAGVTVSRFLILGTPGAQNAGLLTCIRGAVRITDGVWHEGLLNSAIVRLRAAQTPLAQLLYTGAAITMERLVAIAPSGGINHLFDAAESVETLEMDGSLTVRNCTMVGDVAGGLSYGAMLTLQGGNTTYGSNFQLYADNTAHIGTGTFVRLPTGTVNNARFRVRGNRFAGGAYIGSTEYSDGNALQAAHSAAIGNIDSDPMVTDEGIPRIESPLLSGGVDIGYIRDTRGFQSRRHIGAYGTPTFIRVV